MAWIGPAAGGSTLEANTGSNVLTNIHAAAVALAANGAAAAAVANAGSGGLRSAAGANWENDAALTAFGPGAGNWTDALARQVQVEVNDEAGVTVAAAQAGSYCVSCLNNAGELEVVVYNPNAAAASGIITVKLHYLGA